MLSLYGKLSGIGAIGGSYAQGGNCEDSFPGLTMVECAMSLPVVILESAIDNENAIDCENQMIVECAMNESAEAFDAINESVITGLKDRVKKAYDRIKAFIKSIIAKLKAYLTGMTKSASMFAQKYDTADFRKKDLKGFEFEGYKYVNNISTLFKVPSTPAAITDIIDNVIKNSSGSTYSIKDATDNAKTVESDAKNNGWTNSDKKAGQGAKFETLLEGIKKAESEKSETKAAIFKEITGTEIRPDKVNEDFFKLVRGKDKKTLKEGDAGFKRGDILERMKRTDEIDSTIKSYETLHDAVEKLSNDLVYAIDKLEDATGDSLSGDDKEKFGNYKSALIDTVKGANSMYQTALAGITQIKGLLTGAIKDRDAQDRKMLMQMVNYKNKSAKNNSVEEDEFVDDFDFEI